MQNLFLVGISKKSENSCNLFGEKTQSKSLGSDERNETSDGFKRISREHV